MDILKQREKFYRKYSIFEKDGLFYTPEIISDFASEDEMFVELLREQFPEHSFDFVCNKNTYDITVLLSKKININKCPKIIAKTPEIALEAVFALKELYSVELKERLDSTFKDYNEVVSDKELSKYEDRMESAENDLNDLFDKYIDNKIRKKVIKQAKRIGGFFDIELEKEGELKLYKIPKLPFYYWAINARFFGELPKKLGLESWDVVSSVGAKMQNDCPYHSDWWFGMGLTKKDYEQDDGEIMSQLTFEKWELQRKLLSHEVTVLAGGKKVEAEVQHYDDFKEDFSKVKEDRILILPSLELKFEVAILKAVKNGKGGVICESGGKAAHLSKVGREMNFPVIMIENALTVYEKCSRLKINPEKGRVSFYCGQN